MRRFLRELRGWNIRYGDWWMLQWQANWWASFGIHVDVKSRRVASGDHAGMRYGPYVDLHLGCLVASFGFRPYLTGELVNQSGIARGGRSVPSSDPLYVARTRWSFHSFAELVLIALLILNVVGTYMRVKRWGFP